MRLRQGAANWAMPIVLNRMLMEEALGPNYQRGARRPA